MFQLELVGIFKELAVALQKMVFSPATAPLRLQGLGFSSSSYNGPPWLTTLKEVGKLLSVL